MKTAVCIYGDDHGDHHAYVVLGAFVKFFGKLPILIPYCQGRPTGSGVALPADLEFDISIIFVPFVMTIPFVNLQITGRPNTEGHHARAATCLQADRNTIHFIIVNQYGSTWFSSKSTGVSCQTWRRLPNPIFSCFKFVHSTQNPSRGPSMTLTVSPTSKPTTTSWRSTPGQYFLFCKGNGFPPLPTKPVTPRTLRTRCQPVGHYHLTRT